MRPNDTASARVVVYVLDINRGHAVQLSFTKEEAAWLLNRRPSWKFWKRSEIEPYTVASYQKLQKIVRRMADFWGFKKISTSSHAFSINRARLRVMPPFSATELFPKLANYIDLGGNVMLIQNMEEGYFCEWPEDTPIPSGWMQVSKGVSQRELTMKSKLQLINFARIGDDGVVKTSRHDFGGLVYSTTSGNSGFK